MCVNMYAVHCFSQVDNKLGTSFQQLVTILFMYYYSFEVFSFIYCIAKLMSFSEIQNALHPPANEQTLLKCVQQHAVLVQGSWVVKRSTIERYRLMLNCNTASHDTERHGTA